MPVVRNMTNALLDDRLEAIRGAQITAGMTRAELDLSGGIDSALMACLLVMALGPENVTLVHSRFSTSSDQTKRAQDLADALNCPLVDAHLDQVWEILQAEMTRSLKAAGYDMDEIKARIEADPTIEGSIRSCLRAPIGRGYNRMTGGGLRYGTGNECEDRFLRFYQKGGDGEVDNNPVVMLSKGEVYQLVWFLSKRLPLAADVLIETIKAIPTPDLRKVSEAGYSDEDELLSWTGVPFTYSRIDVETGEYNYVGTIERVSRFLDLSTGQPSFEGQLKNGDLLFSDNLSQDEMRALVNSAMEGSAFEGCQYTNTIGNTLNLLTAARRTERITRHKENPAIPSYGTRAGLVARGILTNNLPII